MYPKSLQELIDSFRNLPGVGEKSAERYALNVLDWKDTEVQSFAQALLDVKEKLHYCNECGNLTEDDTCDICNDPDRNHEVIFVVQSSKDVLAMEKTNEYHGVYIDSLIQRAKNAKEIILATNTTMDGETTAMYLNKLLHAECPEVLVTRISHGLPTGGMLDYADEMTLTHALSDRRKM